MLPYYRPKNIVRLGILVRVTCEEGNILMVRVILYMGYTNFIVNKKD